MDVVIVPRGVMSHMRGVAIQGLPNEVCGLVAGPVGSNRIAAFFPCRNADRSTETFTLDPVDGALAMSAAERAGLTVCGYMHSHPTAPAIPSSWDIACAPDPAWYYLIVSLMTDPIEVRAFRFISGEAAELHIECA
jgi:[CysO sulfur-carrier protein]-S-L-cysteine hydrolase